MPKKTRHGLNKEIERLKGRRKKAQDKGDIAEEAKICNTIGELYAEDGDYRRALHFHQCELSLSEGGGDRLGAAIAHRRIGECYCEMGHYSEALSHQTMHLEIARELGNLIEEQRALATLGRTYFVHSHSELEQGSGQAAQLSRKASMEYQRSLDVCDRLIGQISDREVLEMKSRLYLNLGLVYETQADIKEARKFMENALSIGKELGLSSTVFKCHFDLGSLHLKERHPSLALGCFREALKVARDKKNQQWEAEALREMGQAYAQLGDFENAKSSFKKVTSLPKLQMEENELEQLLQDLKAVRKIIHYSGEVNRASELRDRLTLYERLGDLCCGVKAFSTAVKYYGQQLTLAETSGLQPRELSSIYVSLARTHTDCGQYSQALLYYHKELDLWKGNIIEECDTWNSIAKVSMSAGHEPKVVLDAYRKAYTLAEKGGSVKRQVSLCKSVLKHYRDCPDSHSWKGRLTSLVSANPEFQGEVSSDSEEESQATDRSLSEPPPSLPSSDYEDDDDTPPLNTGPAQTRAVVGLAVRKKSRVNKRNEKGETLLHVAAIDGNAALVKQLAKEGAEVNVRDHCGWTPLHEASNHGYLDTVCTLLDYGAAINDPGGAHCGGVTPLIDAAINGHVEVVRLLVDRGADVSIRNSEGHSALSVLMEKLSSDPEYDLREEHTAIRDYLRRVGAPEDAVQRSKGRSSKDRRIGFKSTKDGSESSRSRFTDRTGAGVLYSSDEEDPPRLHKTHKSKPSNPFEPFTVGSHSHTSQPGPSRLNSEPHTESRNQQTSLVSHKKGVFNPLGQVEIPALLPAEDDIEEMCTDHINAAGQPVIDGWLVDDMGQPPAKRKRWKSGPETGPVLSIESSVGRRKGGQLRLRKTGSTQKLLSTHRSSSRSLSPFERSVIEIDDFESGHDDVMFNEDFGASVSTQSAGSNALPHNTASTQQPLPSYSGHAQNATKCPLRVRVRIESKSHLIPCPKKLADGSGTTIEWLIKQATERYYTQEGVRPELSLTTPDGALLCPSDLIEDVLGHNEEVVGVVKQWHLPPLLERYQMACKSAQIEPNSKVSRQFESNPSPVTVDLSDHFLLPVDCGPLSQALQSQITLTSLSLSGNRLKDKGVEVLSACLSTHSALQVLDLSCTAITSQGLENLARPSTDSPSHWSTLRSLNLSYNSLGVACGFSLKRLLDKTKDLQELNLDHCGLSAVTFQSSTGLLDSLKNLPGLQSLSLAGNSLGVEGVSSLISALPLKLSKLSLSGACDNGLSIVAAFQQSTPHFSAISKQLEVLNISHCSVMDSCLVSQVSMLEGCDVLKELHLAGNAISGKGLQPLCRYLSIPTLSPNIQVLDLSGNLDIGRSGLQQLLAAFTQRKSVSSSLTHAHSSIRLSLCDCGIASPLPAIRNTNLLIVTNLTAFVKAKQLHSDKFPVLLELYGNVLCKSELESWLKK